MKKKNEPTLLVPENNTPPTLEEMDEEAESMERANGIREMEADEIPVTSDNITTLGNIYSDSVNQAKSKLGGVLFSGTSKVGSFLFSIPSFAFTNAS